MEKTACAEVLRDIGRGDVDLDKISELMRSSDLVIRSCQSEIENLKQRGEQLELGLEREKNAADDLTRRLVKLHEENRQARQVFQAEIEGRCQILGVQMGLDLEALDMEGLIRERESSQEDLGKALGMGKP